MDGQDGENQAVGRNPCDFWSLLIGGQLGTDERLAKCIAGKAGVTGLQQWEPVSLERNLGPGSGAHAQGGCPCKAGTPAHLFWQNRASTTMAWWRMGVLSSHEMVSSIRIRTPGQPKRSTTKSQCTRATQGHHGALALAAPLIPGCKKLGRAKEINCL